MFSFSYNFDRSRLFSTLCNIAEVYTYICFISYSLILKLNIFQILKDKGEDAKKIGIMVASHNEDTVRFAIQKMKEIGISPEDKVICFGQLLGMCDYITMPLGNIGILN